MKKKICLLLSLLLLQVNVVFAQGPKNIEDPIKEQVETPLEEKLSEEELKKIREAEIKAAFDKQVEKHKNRSIEDLTTSYLLGDFKSGDILESDNIDQLVAIASTTKILTIYVALDQIKSGQISLSDRVTIDKSTSRIGGSSFELKEGEEVSVEDLIKASMIVSGNDAVDALAKHISGSQEAYIRLMKKKLEDLAITEYKIINVSGLPNYVINEQNMLSTRSLFILATNFLKDYPEILEVTNQKSLTMPLREFDEKNTNPLLGVLPEIDGLKTGYTGMAGRCMVATGLVLGDGTKNADMRLIGITMGSNSDAERYVAIKKLMEAGFSNYENVILGDCQLPLKTIHDEKFEPEDVNVYPKDAVEFLKKKSDKISSSIDLKEITPPLKSGDKVGTVVYTLNNENIYQSDLIVKNNIIESSFIKKLQILYRNMYIATYKLFNS